MIGTIIQDAISFLNLVVIALGYYSLVRLYRAWFAETKRERTAGGRPQVVVAVDHSHLPKVGLVVGNPSPAPAKDISFGFSAPIQSSDGCVLSDLPFFRKGLPYLEPQGRIQFHWDHLPSLAPLLIEKGLEDGVRVTVRYKDLAEERYESAWDLNPLLLEGGRIEDREGMNDLVDAVERISGSLGALGGNGRTTGGDTG